MTELGEQIIELDQIFFPSDKEVKKWPEKAQKFVERMRFLFAGMLIGSNATGDQIKKLVESLNGKKI